MTILKRAVLAAYRIRVPLYYVAAVILVGNVVVTSFVALGVAREPVRIVVMGAFVVVGLCLLLAFLAPRLLAVPETRVVTSPVRGRWVGVNSPATKVPSHGVRVYGQASAIDLVHDEADAPRPDFGGEPMRSPDDYPAFGQPVFAMIDGTVVRASAWRRDHRARSNLWGVLYMMVEGVVRELGGPGFVVGNHVTIRGDDGVFATVAHLQQGSVEVQVGDRVGAGSVIGRCGNSGNSSEPHVHAQLMDRVSLWTAQGVPMAFGAIAVGDSDEPVDGLPGNDVAMVAG